MLWIPSTNPTGHHYSESANTTTNSANQANLNYPYSTQQPYNVGNRVVILDNYLNLYGTTGEVTEVHPVQLTL